MYLSVSTSISAKVLFKGILVQLFNESEKSFVCKTLKLCYAFFFLHNFLDATLGLEKHSGLTTRGKKTLFNRTQGIKGKYLEALKEPGVSDNFSFYSLSRTKPEARERANEPEGLHSYDLSEC